jgi:6-phosphogluconolactonase
MTAHRYSSPDATAEACAQFVIGVLKQALSAREFATLAVSGGSTPKLMFQKLAVSGFPWERVHLFWVDERCVPPTDSASNFKLTDDSFIQPAHMPPQQVHRILGELDPQVAARRYADELRQFFGLAEGEMPHFDLIHRGIGPDAHTASLFPGEPLIDDHQNLTAAVYAPQFKQWRVTLLPGPLMAAKQTVMLVAGEDKVEAIRAVFQDPYEPKKYPAQIATREGDPVTWFLDEKSAALLP